MTTQQEIKNREFLIKEIKKTMRDLEARKTKYDETHVNVYYIRKTGDTFHNAQEARDAYDADCISGALYRKICRFFDEADGGKNDDKYAYAIRYLDRLVSNLIQEIYDYDKDYDPFKIGEYKE